MRKSPFLVLPAVLALTISAGVLAQGKAGPVPQLAPAQVAQLDTAADAAALDSAVEALIDSGANPRAVAAALASRGQTNQQITSTLGNGGVAPQDLGQSLQAANIARSTQPPVGQAPSSEPAVQVTGAGLLVGEGGDAVYVRDEDHQTQLAAAFVSGQVAQNPSHFKDANAARGVGQVLSNAIVARNPNANPTAVARAVVEALQSGEFGTGGNSSAVLARALQNAAENIGRGIKLPPVSPNS